MSKMGDGYGSECHLLRWMGRHRNVFNRAVQVACGTRTGEQPSWLDCNFDPSNQWPDGELTGLSFLHDEVLLKAWQNFWPQTGQSPNWDAVGRWGSDGSRELILVEAKAHLREIESMCKAKENGGRPKIRAALKHTARSLGAAFCDLWITKHYQLANRLAVLNFLHEQGCKAHLVLVYFVGDVGNANRITPQTPAGWRNALVQQKQDLGLPENHKLTSFVKSLFLHISRPEAWLCADDTSPCVV